MGQQQLLLLVLGIVIVGLAVVAGINAFDENQQKSSQDALTQEAFRLASDAKAFYNKPEQFSGGGGDDSALNSIVWQDIGVQADQLSNTDASTAGGTYDTPWGSIGLSGGSDQVTFALTLNNADDGDDSTTDAFGSVVFDPDSDDDQISFSRN